MSLIDRVPRGRKRYSTAPSIGHTPGETDMANARLIRKYVNRRLYDTSQSRYVNLDDLRKLIIEGAALRVVDQSSGDDITTTVLLQIIEDAQRSGAILFSAEFLSDLIRASAQERDPGLPRRLNDALRDAIANRPASSARSASATSLA